MERAGPGAGVAMTGEVLDSGDTVSLAVGRPAWIEQFAGEVVRTDRPGRERAEDLCSFRSFGRQPGELRPCAREIVVVQVSHPEFSPAVGGQYRVLVSDRDSEYPSSDDAGKPDERRSEETRRTPVT